MEQNFCKQLFDFLAAHWVGVSGFSALVYFSFVNALPERKEDFDWYSVAYHFLRGLTPTSRLIAPPRIPNDPGGQSK